MCCSICAASTGVEGIHMSMGCHFACPSRMSTTITPTSNVFPSTPRTKTWSKASRTSHYVAIGSGQGHARLNGGRREFIGCSRLHLQIARHWAFGHAKFRGRAGESGKWKDDDTACLTVKARHGVQLRGCCRSFDASSCVTRVGRDPNAVNNSQYTDNLLKVVHQPRR